MTQQEIILKLLAAKNDWIPSYNLIKVNTEWGYLGTSADREARKMAENNDIDRKRDGKYTYYKLKSDQRLLNVPEAPYNPLKYM